MTASRYFALATCFALSACASSGPTPPAAADECFKGTPEPGTLEELCNADPDVCRCIHLEDADPAPKVSPSFAPR